MINSYNVMKRAAVLTLAIGVLVLAASAGEPQDKKTDKAKGPAWLGVMIQDVTNSLAKEQNLKTESGAYVTDVVKKSPAESAGLKEGDVITSFAGKEVTNAEDLTKAVQAGTPGTKASISVFRDGENKNIEVTLGEARAQKDIAYRIAPAPMAPDRMVRIFMGGGTLGMEVMTLNEQLAAYFGAPDDEGVLVESVEKESPAEKAGFKAGDVIIRVGKKSIDEVDEIHRALRKYKEGDKVEFEIVRKGEKKVLTYIKEAAPESDPNVLFRGRLPRSMYDGDENSFEYWTPGPERQWHIQMKQLNKEMLERMQEMPKVIKKAIRINAGSDV